MRNLHGLRWLFQIISLIAVVEMSGCAVVRALPFGGDSWQEEVLLHDGRKLLITRSQTYGGRHEIGQPSPIKEHTITFTLPGSANASAGLANMGRTSDEPIFICWPCMC